MKSIASLSLALLMLSITGVNAHTDDMSHEGFCQNAQTTADLVDCSSRHLDARNAYMKDLYPKIQDYYKDDEGMSARLEERQKQWITFRDDTCADEGDVFAGGSLAPVQRLMCHARMTKEWTDHLKIMVAGDAEEQLPVFSSPTRWTNVLINDYPNVYWNFNEQTKLDMDCDSKDELVVRGIRKNKDDMYQPVYVVAATKATGRPHVRILNFDDQKNCVIQPEFELVTMSEDEAEADQSESCNRHVKIKTENCGDYTLTLDAENDSYTLTPFKKEENK